MTARIIKLPHTAAGTELLREAAILMDLVFGRGRKP